MSGGGIDRITRSCINILLATIAIYCALCLLKRMLPTLIVIGGVIGIAALVVGTIVVIRTLWQRW